MAPNKIKHHLSNKNIDYFKGLLIMQNKAINFCKKK